MSEDNDKKIATLTLGLIAIAAIIAIVVLSMTGNSSDGNIGILGGAIGVVVGAIAGYVAPRP